LEQQLLLKEVRIGRRSQELPSWTGVVSAIKVAQEVSEGAGSAIRPLKSSNHGSQLIEYLKGHFTEEIAAKVCSKLGIVKTEHLVFFSDSDINGLGLMDPHRKILLQLVNEAKIYQKAVAGAVRDEVFTDRNKHDATARFMSADDTDSASVAANAASSEDQGGDWSSE
jgi:hypothetical protein